jgi:hypothetical protein
MAGEFMGAAGRTCIGQAGPTCFNGAMHRMKLALLLLAVFFTRSVSLHGAEIAALYKSDFKNDRYGCIPAGWQDLIAERPSRNWAVDGNGFVRFMLKLRVDYPDRATEKEIMRRMAGKQLAPIERVATRDEIFAARAEISELYMDDKIADYIVDIVHATREPGTYGLGNLASLIEYGASPRATIFLSVCARANAYLRGRGYVLPDDVKAIAPDVLRHRIITSFEAEAEEVTSDHIISRIFEAVDVP